MISHKSRVAPCYEIIISWFYFMLMLTHITNCNSWRAMENCLEVMRCGIMCCEQTGECGQHNLHNTLTLFTLTSSSGNWIILENGDLEISDLRGSTLLAISTSMITPDRSRDKSPCSAPPALLTHRITSLKISRGNFTWIRCLISENLVSTCHLISHFRANQVNRHNFHGNLCTWSGVVSSCRGSWRAAWCCLSSVWRRGGPWPSHDSWTSCWDSQDFGHLKNIVSVSTC